MKALKHFSYLHLYTVSFFYIFCLIHTFFGETKAFLHVRDPQRFSFPFWTDQQLFLRCTGRFVHLDNCGLTLSLVSTFCSNNFISYWHETLNLLQTLPILPTLGLPLWRSAISIGKIKTNEVYSVSSVSTPCHATPGQLIEVIPLLPAS